MRRELYKILICFVCVMKLFHGLSLGALTKPSIPHRLLHTSRDKTVVVVGGGAAGYFSAIECASKLQSENMKAKVYVLEAGRSVLSKVLISGGGRCNVMHNPNKTTQEISQGYPRGQKELLGPITSRFGPKEAHDWFTSRGVQLKTERDGRVFPTTDRSDTIADTLKTAAQAAGVQVVKGAKVLGVRWTGDSQLPQRTEGRFSVTFQTSSSSSSGEGLKSRRSSLYEGLEAGNYGENSECGRDVDSSGNSSSNSVMHCDCVIMATGSSRLGYEIVRGLGHSMRDPLPSLFSFKVKDSSLNALSGVSCKSAKVSLVIDGSDGTGQGEGGAAKRKKAQVGEGLVQRGPLLVTRQGLSGPAVLKLSAFGARLMSACQYKFLVEVSWLGDVGVQALREHFLAVKKQHPGRQVGRFFPQLSADLQRQVRAHFPATTAVTAAAAGAEEDELDLHMYGVSAVDQPSPPQDATIKGEEESGQISRRLWQYLLRRQGIEDPQIRWGQLSAQAILGLAQEITQGRFAVDGRGLYRDEFVTCGGVQLGEVAFRSMQSRVRPGLFLAGEVLDLDGVTGGYNFQSAWTTGFIAGQSCALSLIEADATDCSS